MLAALGLAGHHHAGRHVGDAHRRFGLVDVLAAGTGGTVHVGLQVGRVDVDVDAVIHFRRHEHRGEAGVAAVVRIERALAHQPVHADLGLQPAIGEIALDAEGGRLDAGHVAAGHFHQLGLPATALGPAQVHAQQDFGPVLGFGATGTGLDVDEGVGRVHLPGEHALEFQLLDLGLVAIQVGNHRQRGVLVLLALGQLQQFAAFAQAIEHAGDADHGLLQQRALAAEVLRVFGVVPDVRVFQLPGYFLKTLFLGVVVKDTP